MRAGWPVAEVARRCGLSASTLHNVLEGKHEHCTVATARGIDRTFRDLASTPGPSIKARRLAERRGYAPALAWDDIDTDDDIAATERRAA